MRNSLVSSLSFVALSLLSVNAFAQEAPASAPPPPPGPPPAYAPAYGPPPGPAPMYIAAPARPRPDREGFTIGFGLGGGTLEIDDQEIDAGTTVGISLRAGYGISQNLLIQGTLEGTSTSDDYGNSLDLTFSGVSLTGYVHPRIFLSGGLGWARLSTHNDDGEETGRTDDSVALLAGVGIEAYQSNGFALSVELRGFAAEFPNTAGEDVPATGANVLLGFQWF
jgi:hypothetical protein